MEPPPTPLIKETCNNKSDKHLVTIKLRRDLTSSTSDLYEFKISLFDHGELGEFLLFIQNFNMTLAATGILDIDAKIYDIHMLVHGEALRQFDML